ncbi:MAG TPA: methyltransferase domain-containing protein [Gemmatimonadaceae bacterium]|nr:methyltransferase domain-containing protein [Gemmatimonadaceae bacterium]
MSGRSKKAGDGETLRQELERRFRTKVTPVDIAAWHIELLHPADPESLISEEDFDRDERLPYWADVWPSSIIMSRHVAMLHGAGRSLLELGSGAGLVATAAALAGFDVTASDYYEDSLRFTRANVQHHTGREPTVHLLDWRALPARLPRYDVVVGSDVLYERQYGALVAETISRTLKGGGVAYITDPGRIATKDFVEECARRGLHVRTLERIPFNPEAALRQMIDIYEIRWEVSSSEML